MDTYQSNLAGLLGLSAALFLAQKTLRSKSVVDKSFEKKDTIDKKAGDAAKASQWSFLAVYALVMGSDWLQVRVAQFKPPSPQLSFYFIFEFRLIFRNDP